MTASTPSDNSGAARGLPPPLRWALIASPLLLVTALEVAFGWRLLPLAEGASALAAIVGSVSAPLGAYRLIRSPASRTVGAFILTGINVPICVASFAFLAFKLTEPPSGFIAVDYDGVTASDVFLVVENKSTQAIYIRSYTNKKVWPGYFRTTCRAFDIPEQYDPLWIADGLYSTTKVAPGERIRLDVPTELPNQFKEGAGGVHVHCRIRLTLEGGTFVETNDFEPR